MPMKTDIIPSMNIVVLKASSTYLENRKVSLLPKLDSYLRHDSIKGNRQHDLETKG